MPRVRGIGSYFTNSKHMAYHAKLSPSSAHRWTDCTASINAQEGIPNTNSDASRAGTCCHQIQAEVLTDKTLDLQAYLGRKMLFWSRAEDDKTGEDWSDLPEWEKVPLCLAQVTGVVVVTQEMIDAVATAVAYVLKVQELRGGTLLVEQSVPVGQFTGEEGATGSTDVALVGDSWIWIADSKFGRAKVQAYDVLVPAHTDIVSNEPVPEKVRANLQMASYALGTIELYGQLSDINDVTMTIIQPFVHHVSEYTCTLDELRQVEVFMRGKANETRTNPKFSPSNDNCHFCRASGNCDAQTAMVLETTLQGFDDVTIAAPKPISDVSLGTKYALLGMISDWCRAIEARVWDALHAGQPVSRSDGVSYKLVLGKKGDRDWIDKAEAEETMLGMRLKKEQIFKQVLLGPAAIEKLAKAPKVKKGETPIPPVLSDLRWNRLQKLITQSDGKPTIALETDPRPAIAAATDGFDDVPLVEENSDLF